MAKRKRLGPAALMAEPAQTGPIGSVSGPMSSPPIAQVAGAAAAEAAVREMADEMADARAQGRLVQDVALEDIDEYHLNRDRIVAREAEMDALEASIAARGQQAPIDLVELDTPGEGGARFGLISGWRRLQVIKRLHARLGEDRFATVRAVLRRPESSADAYQSMVEENELRVGLSYYERAQVAARASDLGVFDGSHEAISTLFAGASKAKRSKIGAFVRIFRVLDDVLHFPSELPERLGLRLAKALDDGRGGDLYKRLTGFEPGDPAGEQAYLLELLGKETDPKPANRVEKQSFPGGIDLVEARGGLKLSGPGVTDDLRRDLAQWLASRGG